MRLHNVKYLLTTHDLNLMPQDDKDEIVIVGKSNVGKSTFINLITDNKKLAKVSGKPGKTRAISFFDVNGKFRLVDIPGYGYAKVSRQQLHIFAKMLEVFFSERKNIKKVIFLLDSRRKINQDDLDMLFFLTSNNIPFTILGTKLDKLNQSMKSKFIKNIKKELNTTPLLYSALTKKNLDLVLGVFAEYL